MTGSVTIRVVGDGALLLEVEGGQEPPHWLVVEAAFDALRDYGLPAIVNLHPAESCLLVEFDPRVTDPHSFEAEVRRALAFASPAESRPRRTVEIPVCYEPPCAPDLADVAASCGISPAGLARAHAEASYTVHFLGFTAGFPYLGGLPAALAAPRLATPRKRVPPGSVAIGGRFTGIYPGATPGGWRLIGRTPLRLFDPAASPPNLLSLGDEVRFRPIPLSELETA